MKAINIGKICPSCKEFHAVLVWDSDYIKWRRGALIQSAFPYLSGGQREILMTGYCEPCWNKIFDTGEDE